MSHTKNEKSYIVIPARLASTRLPRKLLLRETGKSLLQHTYEAACRARKPAGVCVAADHEEIAAEVRAFGGRVFMTSTTCASGTDRLAAQGQARVGRLTCCPLPTFCADGGVRPGSRSGSCRPSGSAPHGCGA